MDAVILERFDASLNRCVGVSDFLDKFYDIFLAASPKVKEKFADTDFVVQKRALRASLHLLLLAAQDETKGPQKYLRDIAASHSRKKLDIGAELYDIWLDSLLATVQACDPEYSPEVEDAWERVMMIGIHYMISKRNDPPNLTIID